MFLENNVKQCNDGMNASKKTVTRALFSYVRPIFALFHIMHHQALITTISNFPENSVNIAIIVGAFRMLNDNRSLILHMDFNVTLRISSFFKFSHIVWIKLIGTRYIKP